MKSTGVSEFSSGSGQGARASRGWLIAAVLLCSAAAAGAQQAAGSVIEISTSNRPRFDSADGSSRTQQRVAMALLSPGRSAFGVTMGLSTQLASTTPGFAPARQDGPTGVNLGLQWRYVLDKNRRVDITAWRDIGRPSDALAMVQSRDTAYGARVELELALANHNFVTDRGFVGMQLDSGARITLHRSGGKPMVYYRNQF